MCDFTCTVHEIEPLAFRKGENHSILQRIFLKFCNCYFFRCDADPAALAKYVFALVKKDKPVADLRASMVEQLDVFLQSGMFICSCLLHEIFLFIRSKM
jgi:hypothetical protein